MSAVPRQPRLLVHAQCCVTSGMCRRLRVACRISGAFPRSRAGIAIAIPRGMAAYAVDETIRVEKLEFGLRRSLPQQFAPQRTRYWAHIAAALIAFAALASPIDVSQAAARSAHAQEVLRSLGR
jgi:hypothetical protein